MDAERSILLRGVRVHNLKGVDLDLPLNRLIVVSGVSGAGKSSLAFDTLYAEGQRRYVETFSTGARQFLERLDKPDADRIERVPPAVAVSQGSSRRSSRSTVGSVTEVQDHLGLLFAKFGTVVCHDCGSTVRPADPSTVNEAIEKLPDRARYQVAFPMEVRPDSDRDALADALREDGLLRARAGGVVVALDARRVPEPGPDDDGTIDVIVDRLVRGADPQERRLDSIETAFSRGLGRCRLILDGDALTFFQGWKCGGCGRDYVEPDVRLFRENGAVGACPRCEGLGRVTEIDLGRVVPDPSRTIRGGAITAWSGTEHRRRLDDLLAAAPALGLPTDVPFRDLDAGQARAVLEGPAGLLAFLRSLEAGSNKREAREFLAKWRSERPCPACRGAKLRPEALAVKVGGLDIASVTAFRAREARAFLEGLAKEFGPDPAARRVLDQADARLGYLERIGLGYLTLDRPARALSGGEAQRVALAAALGSGLVNTLYVLDEPSAGLHPADVGRLIECLIGLRDSGNTLVVVEHDHALLRAADLLIDLGPGAGEKGGTVVFNGPPATIDLAPEGASVTADFLLGRRKAVPGARRRPGDKGRLRLSGAVGHNLKGVDVEFPLGVLCVVAGVSGSGKSTLVRDTLYPALRRRLGLDGLPGLAFLELSGAELLGDATLIDDAPIGRSGRSNPVTYLKAFDEMRRAFAATHEAKLRNYGPNRFSFNVEGGRCNACEGNGFKAVDMQFLPDVIYKCPECGGTRYRDETLEVTYRGKNIAEVLDLTAREAFGFFKNRPKVQSRLRPLLDIGLDYLRLGQPASTLSGGEAQRLKLASRLATTPGALTRAASGRNAVYVLDEPTRGLHPADSVKLLEAFESLLSVGHSLIVIEHRREVVVSADWVIELGPGAGDDGGTVVAEGTPEQLAQLDTPTGLALAEWLRP